MHRWFPILWLVAGLPARAGQIDGFVAVDTLVATSRTNQANAGPPSTMAADLGLTVRTEVAELRDRLVVGIDYRGRIPYAGAFRNREQHLLFRADAVWRAKGFEVGVGRFFAPSAIWLSMDGVRATVRPGRFHITAFAGRRAISLSRRNVPLDVFLPVAGGAVGVATDKVRADVAANVAGDRLVLGNPGDEVEQDIVGGSARTQVVVRASERVAFGGRASVANDATFSVGPDVGDLVVTVRALSLYRASAWSSWRVSPAVRLGATLLHQRVSVVADEALGLALVDPSFTDVRVRAVLGRPTLGFLRPDVRLRRRSTRTELRLGGAAELHPTRHTGFYGFTRGWIERGLAADPRTNHLRWQIGGGFEQGAAQFEAGVGVVDRAAGPISGRVPDRGGNLQPTSQDLSPFVLEAQNTGFARAFVTRRTWFVGVDVEANLLDREVRAFVQVGALGRKSWGS